MTGFGSGDGEVGVELDRGIAAVGERDVGLVDRTLSIGLHAVDRRTRLCREHGGFNFGCGVAGQDFLGDAVGLVWPGRYSRGGGCCWRCWGRGG